MCNITTIYNSPRRGKTLLSIRSRHKQEAEADGSSEVIQFSVLRIQRIAFS